MNVKKSPVLFFIFAYLNAFRLSTGNLCISTKFFFVARSLLAVKSTTKEMKLMINAQRVQRREKRNVQ